MGASLRHHFTAHPLDMPNSAAASRSERPEHTIDTNRSRTSYELSEHMTQALLRKKVAYTG